MTTLRLPVADGEVVSYKLHGTGYDPGSGRVPDSRVAFAAAHVVADPFADITPGQPARLDWDSTLAFRRHLVSYGLGVAEAMDTAQRGMGLDWATTRKLIRRSAAQVLADGGRIAAGAGTDHVTEAPDLAAVVTAYLEQLELVESTGSQPIIMASRHLVRVARHPDDYRAVYGKVLGAASRPVILHWLGAAFDPALAGYWGFDDVAEATAVLLDVIGDNVHKVDGVKVSLLDADHERAVRAALPAGIRLYTGDDFNYPELIRGDGVHHSDALLGIFAAIAPAASAALHALDDGDLDRYESAFAPTLPLARQIFSSPTYFYKTGIAFLAWLSGLQPGFTMVSGLQASRSVVHLAETFVLADNASLLPDPDLAATRMSALLAVAGISQ
jgi:hypothetical protein